MRVYFQSNARKDADLVVEIQEGDFWPDPRWAPNKHALQGYLQEAVAASDVLARLKSAFEQFKKEAEQSFPLPKPAASFWKRPSTLPKAAQKERKRHNKAQKKARRRNR